MVRTPPQTYTHKSTSALDHDAPLGLVGAGGVRLRQAARVQAIGIASAQQSQLRHEARCNADLLRIWGACMWFRVHV